MKGILKIQSPKFQLQILLASHDTVPCQIIIKLSFLCIFFIDLQTTEAQSFIILLKQYCSAILRPSDHTVVRPRAEIRTRDRKSRARDSDQQTTTPPFFVVTPSYFRVRAHYRLREFVTKTSGSAKKWLYKSIN